MSVESCMQMSQRSSLFLKIPTIVLSFLCTKDLAFFFNILLIAMKSEISFCFRGTVLAYFKVYRIIRRHYNQIQGSGLFQNFSPPSIDLAKYNKPVASMLCILLLFSICVLAGKRRRKDSSLPWRQSGANCFVIVFQSRVVPLEDKKYS